MGRSDWQPYLYDAPTETDSFNPKAVTIASRLPPSSPTKKPEGPLINFNRHPDSYVVLPYGNTDAKPMNPKVKVVVKVVRWIQFALRICTLLGAVGALLCGIFIKGAQDTEGWIMRIPVCVRPTLRPPMANNDSPASTLLYAYMPSIISYAMQSRARRQARRATTSLP